MLDDQLRRVVLRGDPGIGTSTACRALMRRHATERSREIPFLVQVREFAATVPPARSVAGHVEYAAEAFFQVRPPEGALARLLSAGQALIIFDGLAELTVAAAKAMVSIIELFCREFPEARVLVTAGSADEQAELDPGLFVDYRLAGFAGKQVTDYVHRWFALAPNVPDKDRQRLARAFLAQTALIPDVAINPLRLRLACQTYARDGVLPASLAPGDPSHESVADFPDGRAGSARARILFVEDEQAWLDVISRALPDYHVDMASSYGEALALLQAGIFYDVALIDLNLMDSGEFDSRDQLGGEILHILRNNYPTTRRIAITGWPPSSVRMVLEDFGVDDLLLKRNMTLSDLRHVNEQALALARGHRDAPSDVQSREPRVG
jgi:CheY-like chemotaxis protein